MNTVFTIDIATFRRTLDDAGIRKMALVYHLKIEDLKGYEELKF